MSVYFEYFSRDVYSGGHLTVYWFMWNHVTNFNIT